MMKIRFAKPDDIGQWMQLVVKVKDNFPGLETDAALAEHQKEVLSFIQKGGAICAEADGSIRGILLFSRRRCQLCFLAVDPGCRRQHAAREMVGLMLEQLPPKSDVTVSTYREGDPKGAAARKFYRAMGFVEGRLSEEFGSPVQIFLLRRQSGRGGTSSP